MDECETREDRLDALRARRILKRAQAADPETQRRHTIQSVVDSLRGAPGRHRCPVYDCTNPDHIHPERR